MSPATSDPLPFQAWNAFERLIALILLTALAPLLLAVAMTIAMLSRSSPLIAHRRLGYGGNPFWMLKFRTMWRRRGGPPGSFKLIEHVADDRGPCRKGFADRRIGSRFARFCRRHSIDELPQLLHVVRGEMSLVGPRPITAAEYRRHYLAGAAEILEVKPGISGLWQVKGRSHLSYDQRRDLDLALVRNRSVKLYLRILLWTLPEIWSGRNAW